MNSFLRPSQRQALQDDLSAAEQQLKDPMSLPYIENRAAAMKQAQAIKKALDEGAPKPFEKDEVDAMAKKERELREAMLHNMPSREEMRRNRAGGVHQHREWEKHNKKRLLEWKQIKARLDPTSDDPDLCNFERYRPERPFGYDVTAQIPGVHAMSQLAKENWPEEMAEPKAKTAVSHLKEKVKG